MSRFRKKPVVIEAMQLKYEDGGVSAIMDWAATHHTIIQFDPVRGLSIDTLEGVMRAEMGDWIIKGVKGEFYPCKPDIFEATHEAVPDDGKAPATEVSAQGEARSESTPSPRSRT
jgi:hypothetical protein